MPIVAPLFDFWHIWVFLFIQYTDVLSSDLRLDCISLPLAALKFRTQATLVHDTDMNIDKSEAKFAAHGDWLF